MAKSLAQRFLIKSSKYLQDGALPVQQHCASYVCTRAL